MKILTYKKQENIGMKLARLYYLTLLKEDTSDSVKMSVKIEICELIHDVARITGVELSSDDLSVTYAAANIRDREELREKFKREKEDQNESYSCGI